MATMSRWAIGSPATAGARIATRAAPRRTARPKAARRSRQSSLHPLDPRVHPRDEDLGEQVARHDERGAHRRGRHDDGVVPSDHAFHQHSSDARPGEDRFDEHRAREERRQREPEQRHHRDQRVAEHVPHRDARRRESLRSSDRDEGRAGHVEHGAPHVAGGAADADEGQRDEREGEVPEPVGEALPAGQEVGVEARRAEGGEQPQPIGEHHHQHQPEPVAGQGEQCHRHHGQRRVQPSASRRLEHADRDAEQIAQQQRDPHQSHRRRPRLGERARDGTARRDAGAPVALHEAAEPASRIARGAAGRGRARAAARRPAPRWPRGRPAVAQDRPARAAAGRT